MHEKYFVVSFLFILVSFSMINYPAFATTIEKDQLEYEITGAVVASIEADETFTSLVINLDASDKSKLTIDIPRGFMDSKIGSADDHFFVLVDNQEVIPQETKTDQKRTLSVSFEQNSETVEIIGTSMNTPTLQKMTEPKEESPTTETPQAESSIPSETTQETSQEGGGCLIATAAFGSELAPQIQQLRELRDNTILQTSTGSSFISGFNTLYYSFSPSVADLERQNPLFKEVVKLTITPMISSLSILNYAEINSEPELFVYGIGIILLNVGMYVAVPVSAVIGIKKLKFKTDLKFDN